MPQLGSQIFQRKFRTEWAGSALHEYTEILRDNSLHLIQEANESDKEKCEFVVITHLKQTRDNLKKLLNGCIELKEFKLDEIINIDLGKIDRDVILEITHLCEGIRCKTRDLLSKTGYFENVVGVVGFSVVVLKTVGEMKKEVESIKILD